MTTYFNRSTEEQEIIRKAYEFEKQAIDTLDETPNPYLDAIKSMGIWEAFNEAIEMAYN